ncbi:MAG: potassium transporter TrkA [Candidatus Methanomethylophilaceae archaeon]|nr:potassium transporter TrkA [Candidatus Methanomethylophilaceae archaeon]
MSESSGEYLDLDEIDMTVQELLTEMKDKSEVIVDLAYASLMYNSRDMADKVEELKNEIEDLKYAMRVKVMMAARTKEDAKQLSGILQIASAADRISRSAADIVKLLDIPVENRPYIANIINESDEKFRITRISPKSEMVGHTIGELAVEACTGTRIIALKNRHGWTYDPDDDAKLRAGDDIIVRGSDGGFERLQRFAAGLEPWEFPEVDEDDE